MTFKTGDRIPTPPPPPFPFVYASEMDVTPEPEWQIDGIMEAGSVTLLYGPKDVYKTFVAVDWAMSCAAGKPWLGRDAKRGLVVYITGEGHRGIDRRFKAWAIRHGFDLASLPIARSKWPTQVLDADSMEEWQAHIRQVAETYGVAPSLIVLDTLATNFGPGDQNSPSDMSRFVANVRIFLSGHFGCSALIVHHSGKNLELGARGGSSIEGDSDQVFVLTRVKDCDDTVELACKHIKDGEKPTPVLLKRRVVELGVTDRHGDPVTSLVLDAMLTERQQAIVNQALAGKSQRQMADFLGVSVGLVNKEIQRIKAIGAWPE
jgi:DNA-binding CsgD family transcriptional regulator